jgi:hypothetical protein
MLVPGCYFLQAYAPVWRGQLASLCSRLFVSVDCSRSQCQMGSGRSELLTGRNPAMTHRLPSFENSPRDTVQFVTSIKWPCRSYTLRGEHLTNAIYYISRRISITGFNLVLITGLSTIYLAVKLTEKVKVILHTAKELRQALCEVDAFDVVVSRCTRDCCSSANSLKQWVKVAYSRLGRVMATFPAPRAPKLEVLLMLGNLGQARTMAKLTESKNSSTLGKIVHLAASCQRVRH